MRPVADIWRDASVAEGPTWRRRLRELLTREVVSDLVIAAGGLVVALTGVAAGWVNLVLRLGIEDRMPQVWAVSVVAGILFVTLRRLVRSRARPLGEARVHFFADLKVLAALLALFLGVVYVTKSNDAFARGWILGWALAAPVGLLAVRLVVARLVVPRLGDLLARRLLVAGLPQEVAALRTGLGDLPSGELRVVDVLEGEDAQELARRVAAVVEAQGVDEVVLAAPLDDEEAVWRLCDALVALPVDISLWLGRGVGRLARLGVFEVDPLPRQLLLRRPIRDWGRIAKGLMDRVGAAILLVLLSPLFLLIALAIKLDSPGPVLFRHRRIGQYGRPITVLKFRTMVVDAEQRLRELLASCPQARREWEEKHKLTDDPRITRLGRFLRKTSLDELPQLWNVLRGEMSLVGPRPIVEAEIPKYGPHYAVYAQLKPGITGMWQANGRSDTSYAERTEMDRIYFYRWSLGLDLQLLFRTAWIVLTGRGAY